MRTRSLLVVVLLLATAGTAPAASRFVAFETGQTRPLALAPDGSRLYALNTPDNTLEIFRIGLAGIAHEASVAVGLEPAAVATRGNGEVWVVNHLSDSVSVVDVASVPARVVRTLQVGDEPRDLVFAGPQRVFVTTAHRGQQRLLVPPAQGGGDPQLTTAGVGRADVWVFDAGDPLATLPLRIVTLFGDSPRALAASPDGATVYAAVFQSGNRTSSVFHRATDCAVGEVTHDIDGISLPGGLPFGHVPCGLLPPTATVPGGVAAPLSGFVVQWNAGLWLDPGGRNWTNAVRFALPDLDVFAIDADADPPAQVAAFAGVGTVLFNMAVNPQSGKLYVSNTEARNEVRFEGSGAGGSTVQGRLHEARISVIDAGAVLPRHLNKHIDYGVRPAPASVKEKSLATPLDMAVSADGATLYAAAFGSSKVGVFSTAALEADTFVPDAADHITVSGGGPSGLALDEARGRLYVLTRFDDSVSVVDLVTWTELQHVALHNPEPAQIVAGRPFLYDATTTSSNGEASCASCHVFGDDDGLAWDLGKPEGALFPFVNPSLFGPIGSSTFHPMKGAMVTQSLRGMANNGPMHWRGDRTAAPPAANAFDERENFKKFDVAFVDLNGAAAPLGTTEMGAFADFILEVTYPPNPNRGLDDSLSAAAAQGRADFQSTQTFVPGLTCSFCHFLNPALGQFGTDGRMSIQGTSPNLNLKTPHLRNLYTKVGRFGTPRYPSLDNPFSQFPIDNSFQGDQVRGFGFSHEGSLGSLDEFLHLGSFDQSTETHQDIIEFLLQFDTDFAPAMGQQVTLAGGDPPAAHARLDLLVQRAAAPEPRPGLPAATECELVAKGTVAGEPRGFLRLASGLFQDDLGATHSEASVRALAEAAGNELTFTCVPFGSGARIGIDRDDDSVLDGLDNCAAHANTAQADGDADGAGDACDVCVATADPAQADFDADGVGDRCDDHCVGSGQVTLANVHPQLAQPQTPIVVAGTGFAAGAELDLDGIRSPMTLVEGEGFWIATLVAGIPQGPHAAAVVNAEGCRSLQPFTYTTSPPRRCGLAGFELLGVVTWCAAARHRAAERRRGC